MTLVSCLLLAIGLVLPGWGQNTTDAPGPVVGAHVPAFQLPDQNGHAQDLRSFTGPKGLMLVFFRSADW